MNKRYQVFISSTYADLKEERRYVMQALMELDCIPAGMELFPAAGEDQWEFIKKVIDDCDYYLLIIGGRYGSTATDGISYTEKEFDYALEKGLKVICLLHNNPNAIPVGKSERDLDLQKRLTAFCEKVKKGRIVKFWEKSEELQLLTVYALNYVIRNWPAVGFVRADLVPDENASAEIVRLQKLVSDLQNKLEYVKHNPPLGTGNLSQGDDEFEINISFQFRNQNETIRDAFGKPAIFKERVVCTWNQIFASVAPLLVNEAKDEKIKRKIDDFISSSYSDFLNQKRKDKETVVKYIYTNDEDYDKIKIQLRALGLIIESKRNRSVKDTATYWTLTSYGDSVMTRLIAIKRPN